MKNVFWIIIKPPTALNVPLHLLMVRLHTIFCTKEKKSACKLFFFFFQPIQGSGWNLSGNSLKVSKGWVYENKLARPKRVNLLSHRAGDLYIIPGVPTSYKGKLPLRQAAGPFRGRPGKLPDPGRKHHVVPQLLPWPNAPDSLESGVAKTSIQTSPWWHQAGRRTKPWQSRLGDLNKWDDRDWGRIGGTMSHEGTCRFLRNPGPG